MRVRDTIRAVVTALTFGLLPGACAVQTEPPCNLPCMPDTAYHGPQSEKKRDESPITKVDMFVGPFGWFVEKSPSKTYRPISFDKAYLEFSEKGLAFDDGQKQAILDKIDELGKTKRPVFVVTFVHGWHQNADIPQGQENNIGRNAVKFDYFMARFGEHVRRLFELNGDDNSPAILGVYVGWRGESNNKLPLNYLTIGERARTADVLANNREPGNLRQALQDVAAKVAQTGPENRMLVAGHSLGGRMMSNMFLRDIATGSLYPLGEHVLIAALEPAISASCYDQIFANGIVGRQGMLPSFIAVTSKDDFAVKKGFELGRFAGAIEPPVCGEQSAARNHSIGNYEDYLTHQLDFDYVGEGLSDKPPGRCAPPVVLKYRTWLFTAGTTEGGADTFWQYPWFDAAQPCRQMSGNYSGDFQMYKMNLKRKAAFMKAGAVWNIRVDKNLIDTPADPDNLTVRGIDPRHNAFASTGLADLLGRIAYAQIKWERQRDQTIVPEPTPRLIPRG